MILRVYDYAELKPRAVITRILSAEWTRRFFDSGSFEVHISPYAEQAKELQVGRIITLNGNAGVILYRDISDTDMKLVGHDLKFFLEARVTVPPFVYLDTPAPADGYDRIKGNGETVMKHYVEKHLVNPSDEKRKILHLYIAANQGRGSQIAWQSRFERVSAALTAVSKYSNLGFDIVFDKAQKQFVFDVYEGKKQDVLFCRKYKNISNLTYTEDWATAVSVVYAGGNDEDETQYVTRLEDEENPDVFRAEAYTATSSEDVEEVEDAGYAYLAENIPKETLAGTVNTMYKYRTDWDLGDIVTVRMDFAGQSIFVDKQITGVKEAYTRGTSSVEPIFGDEKENPIKKLLKG